MRLQGGLFLELVLGPVPVQGGWGVRGRTGEGPRKTAKKSTGSVSLAVKVLGGFWSLPNRFWTEKVAETHHILLCVHVAFVFSADLCYCSSLFLRFRPAFSFCSCFLFAFPHPAAKKTKNRGTKKQTINIKHTKKHF